MYIQVGKRIRVSFLSEKGAIQKKRPTMTDNEKERPPLPLVATQRFNDFVGEEEGGSK